MLIRWVAPGRGLVGRPGRQRLPVRLPAVSLVGPGRPGRPGRSMVDGHRPLNQDREG